ncbi:hypothetical protein [Pseudomonas sp. 58 R 12]|nr:hypothetical protein [Pseudomonas sp. 35 E 8]CRM73417.1 hypothetical protein [Pseudomonas sp. 58 R 12]
MSIRRPLAAVIGLLAFSIGISAEAQAIVGRVEGGV